MEKTATCYINGSNDLQCRRRKDRFHRIHPVASVCNLCSFGPRESGLLPNGSSICSCVFMRTNTQTTQHHHTRRSNIHTYRDTNLYSAKNRESESEALNHAFHALHAMRTVDEKRRKKLKRQNFLKRGKSKKKRLKRDEKRSSFCQCKLT